jgi:tRNA nucleotidyltransferase (CCA-adding enzyme)
MLAKVALADSRGRNPHGHDPLTTHDPDVERFLYHAHQAQVEQKPEEPILHGRDIIDWVEPGPEMGKLLEKAYEIQLEEGIKNKEELKRRILQNRNE